MACSLALIDALINIIESINQTHQHSDKEQIVTPVWAKDTETTDCKNNTTKKHGFPFEASISIDNFNEFLKANKDRIKKEGTDFIKNLRDKRGMNLLHCACINECPELIEILISKYDININSVDIDGYSALFYSVNQWSEECVSQLLLFKPRLDLITKDCVVHATGFPIYICGGKTILHQSAETNSVQCLTLILKYIKDINILFKKDFNGLNAMDIAVMHNKPEILNIFNTFIRNKIGDEDMVILKLLNEKQRREIKREYHLKIRERIKESKDNEEKRKEINIATHYKPKYSEMFFKKDVEYFPLHLLDKTLLRLIEELKQSDDKYKIIDKYSNDPINFLKCPLFGIYVFRVFNEDLCDKLLLESENYVSQSLSLKNGGLLPISRPNSMNSYGLVLNSIGMTKSWNYFIKQVIKPLSDILIPPNHEKEWKFKSHHTFIIRYKEGEDINLDTHIDASAVTLNICLGKVGFEGANVYFHAIKDGKDDLEKNNDKYASPHPDDNCKYCRYELVHKIGYGALHVGNYIHGTKTLTKGTRSNVVIWCKEYSK